jgi:uncharacterized protein with GYD domain
MPMYIALYKLTDQGIKNIKEMPQRIEKAIAASEAMGGKVLGVYSVLGEYDLVSIAEFPNDETVLTLALALGGQGNVRSTTLKAFTKEKFAEIVGKLP